MKYNKNYIKIAMKGPIKRLETNQHHLLPLQFIEDSPVIELPYTLHQSLHKNYTNQQLIMDPIGCIIKCIEQRKTIDRIPVTIGCFIKRRPIIKDKKLNKMIKGGFCYNVR